MIESESYSGYDLRRKRRKKERVLRRRNRSRKRSWIHLYHSLYILIHNACSLNSWFSDFQVLGVSKGRTVQCYYISYVFHSYCSLQTHSLSNICGLFSGKFTDTVCTYHFPNISLYLKQCVVVEPKSTISRQSDPAPHGGPELLRPWTLLRPRTLLRHRTLLRPRRRRRGSIEPVPVGDRKPSLLRLQKPSHLQYTSLLRSRWRWRKRPVLAGDVPAPLSRG